MNWEMVGLRHRASNTLYLTQLQPHVAGSPFSDDYAKVQIALKIAALIDWRERHPEDNVADRGHGEGPGDAEGHGEGRGNEDGGGEGLGGEDHRGDEDRGAEGCGDDSNGGWSQPEQGESNEESEPLAAANSSARGRQDSACNKPIIQIDGEQPKQAYVCDMLLHGIVVHQMLSLSARSGPCCPRAHPSHMGTTRPI